MTKTEIFEILTTILKNDIQIQKEIEFSTALLGPQILDSLDFMNYVTIIEEKFEISISDDDISNFKLGIIENMINYILEKSN